MTYKIEITETLQKTIELQANSYEEAVKKVKEQYNSSDIVLDYNDLVDIEIK